MFAYVPVCGFQRIGGALVKSAASHIRTLPDGNSAWWIAITGMLNGADHCPVSTGPLLAMVTAIAADTVVLPAASRARAEIVCAPLAASVESQVNSCGAV